MPVNCRLKRNRNKASCRNRVGRTKSIKMPIGKRKWKNSMILHYKTGMAVEILPGRWKYKNGKKILVPAKTREFRYR